MSGVPGAKDVRIIGFAVKREESEGQTPFGKPVALALTEATERAHRDHRVFSG